VPFGLYAQLKFSVDTTHIRIGEEIKYTIEVEADTTSLVLFPEGQSFSPLEVIESYKVDTNKIDNRFQLIKKYGLTQFDSGAYRIPSQRIMIDDRAFNTDSIDVLVQDVPVDTTKQKMFDIKPIIEVDRPPFNFYKILPWLLAFLIMLGMVYLFFRRKRIREEREKLLPPYEEALVALHKLDDSKLLEADNKSYYTSLTEIVKRYIDREVDDHAMESTTDELIERLMLHKDAGHFNFNAETIKKLESILKRADLVKFAKMVQERGQLQADRHAIEEVINETKEGIPELTEEEKLRDELYREEMERKRKKQRIKQWVIATSAIVVILIGAFIGIMGWQKFRDTFIGNEMKDLAEGRWYRSEYGSPAVIIETPSILVRREDSVLTKQLGPGIDYASFITGEMRDPVMVNVWTVQLPAQLQQAESKIDLNAALDGALNELETRGAKNLIVKRDDFETEKGIKGVRAYGEMNVQVGENRVLKKKSSYVLLMFAQNGGLQGVMVVYQDDGNYAEGVKDRIINSVELEVAEQTGNKQS